MEQSERSLKIMRGLIALVITLSLGASWVERGSPLAARVRAGRPWLFWLCARDQNRIAVPAFALGLYDPLRRSAVLLLVPEDAKVAGKRTLGSAYVEALRATDDERSAARGAEETAQAHLDAVSPEPLPWAGAARIELRRALDPDVADIEIAAARALKAEARSPRAWARRLIQAGRGIARGERDAFDPVLLLLELRRVPLEAIAPAVLPAPAQAPALLSRLLENPALREPEPERLPIVELLNSTDEPGLAGKWAKALRGSVDAISTGSTQPRSRTVVYDRLGDFARAERVRRALNCPSAGTSTRVDPLLGVDATVILGADCAGTPPAPSSRRFSSLF